MAESFAQLADRAPGLVADAVEWDVLNWSRALASWDRAGAQHAGTHVLELGARRGGLALLFASLGAQVTCSDLGGPAPEAADLHAAHGVAGRVTYADLDATDIDLPDASFDAVCFKSILGGIGRHNNRAAQEQTLAEIRRVLRPGGLLFFAENLAASSLHRFLRRHGTSWGCTWRYPELSDLTALLAEVGDVEIRTWGYLATMGRTESQRRALAKLDTIVCRVMPTGTHYLAFGIVRRP